MGFSQNKETCSVKRVKLYYIFHEKERAYKGIRSSDKHSGDPLRFKSSGQAFLRVGRVFLSRTGFRESQDRYS